ncbi:MAG: hypothetical protein J1F18_12545 [Lachnospiraceae bacterium]|nr:hypothetical protein [Lachnospiraceae bacterium]
MPRKPNMEPDTVINMTDCNPSDILSRYQRIQVRFENTGLAVGSYLCGNYFRNLCAAVTVSELPTSYDLVLPILAQHDLPLLEEPRTQLLIREAQHLVVNDPGMLMRLGGKANVRLGRLFFRAYRDHRYPAYEQSMVKNDKLKTLVSALQKTGCKFSAVECEMVGSADQIVADERLNCYYHVPYRLISAIRICEYASVGKPVDQKFLPDDQCGFQCFYSHIEYPDVSFQNGYVKWGRGLYDRVSLIPLKGQNLIIMPELFEGIADENHGSTIYDREY